MLKIKLNNKGFTLIEIIVVLIILGVLAAIAVPAYFNYITTARAAQALGQMKTIKDAIHLCLKNNLGQEEKCLNPQPGLTNSSCNVTAGSHTGYCDGRDENFYYWWANGIPVLSPANPTPQRFRLDAYLGTAVNLNAALYIAVYEDDSEKCMGKGVFASVCSDTISTGSGGG